MPVATINATDASSDAAGLHNGNSNNRASPSPGQSAAATTLSSTNSQAVVQHGIREADKAALDAHPDLQYTLRRWDEQHPREEPFTVGVVSRRS